jgi:hypothetical protein
MGLPRYKCKSCRKKIESTYTAYLQDRSTREGLCENCRDMVQEEDLDKITSECFEKFCHVVNGGSAADLAESMMRTFVRQHRYLQNEFFIALWKFFRLYGARELCDPRNEWAVKVAKRWDAHALE